MYVCADYNVIHVGKQSINCDNYRGRRRHWPKWLRHWWYCSLVLGRRPTTEMTWYPRCMNMYSRYCQQQGLPIWLRWFELHLCSSTSTLQNTHTQSVNISFTFRCRSRRKHVNVNVKNAKVNDNKSLQQQLTSPLIEYEMRKNTRQFDRQMSKGMASLSREDSTPQFDWRTLLECRAVTRCQ